MADEQPLEPEKVDVPPVSDPSDDVTGAGSEALSGPISTGEPMMRAQSHGGALRTGGSNVGGPGRPTNAFRGRVFRSLEERFAIAEAIADGTPLKQTRVELADVTPFLKCAICGASEIIPKDSYLFGDITIRAVGSASPSERLNAIILMAKLSVGEVKDVAADEVRERLALTLDAIRPLVDEPTYIRLLKTIQPIWTER